MRINTKLRTALVIAALAFGISLLIIGKNAKAEETTSAGSTSAQEVADKNSTSNLSTARKRTSEFRTLQSFKNSEEVTKMAIFLLPYAQLATCIYSDGVQLSEGSVMDNQTPLETSGQQVSFLAQKNDCGNGQETMPKNWALLYHTLKEKEEILELDWNGMVFGIFGRKLSNETVELVVAFRGTNFTSLADWRSNLRWITRFFPGKDQYDLVSDHANDIISIAKKRAAKIWPGSTRYRIVTTGHSLGGGLAQLLAYSTGQKEAEVVGAIVFDTTPVTGYFTNVGNNNLNCNVKILRVYEDGEILSYVRGFTRLFYSLSPNIEEIVFDFQKGNFFEQHSMKPFMNGLLKISNSQQTEELILPNGHDFSCLERKTASQSK